jgi:hypothetical protein
MALECGAVAAAAYADVLIGLYDGDDKKDCCVEVTSNAVK